MDPILDDLNAAQREAVEFGEGPLMVLAGAGSGKTRVITRRIARLVRDGAAPSRVLALTFTNKAAGEMARRVVELLPGARVQVSTYHSACARWLRHDAERLGFPRNFSIYDTYDRDSVVKSLLDELGLDTKQFKPAKVGRRLSYLKNLGITADEWRERAAGLDDADRVVADVFQPYQDYLAKVGAMDFDDLLGRFLELVDTHDDVAEAYRRRYDWLLVDEFQDTNRVQYEVTRRLTGPARSVCVVGDPDQSIYKFRGAEIRNLLDFADDYEGAKIIPLEVNYRSTQRILHAADVVIANNRERLEKTLRTDNDEGDRLVSLEFDGPAQEARDFAGRIRSLVEDQGEPADEIAILYRSHFLSRSLEEGLREVGIPYRVVGGVSFYERREIKDLLAFLRVLANPLDEVSMQRVINVPPRGIGKATLDKLRNAAALESMSLVEIVHEPEARSGLSARARNSLDALAKVLAKAQEAAPRSAHEALRIVTEGIGYLDYIGDLGDPEDQARLENVAELHSDATFFDDEVGGGLDAYLQHVSLLTSEDRGNDDTPRVSLMSVHAAKGLEFDHVFIAGMEEGLFPSSRALEEGDVEEERRLMYVALTRARRTVHLGRCRTRMVNGALARQAGSSFLDELPAECVEAASGRPRADVTFDFGSSDPWDEPEPSTEFEPEEFEDSQELPELGPGIRVVHPVYGQGTVLRAVGSGIQTKVTVEFERSGERTLLLEYARLRVVPGGGGGADW